MTRSTAPSMPTGRLRRTARGVVSLLTTVFVATLGLTLLVSVDIGNVFFTQRALQRAADMAAMAAAQRLDIPTQAAQQSVTQNGLSVTPTVVPGVWNATNTAAAPTYFCASGSTGCIGTVNAAQVTLTQNVPYFFSVGQRTLTATAIAKNTAIVSFSLGSGLASTNTGLLNSVLGALLGNGNSALNLDLVSYQGLANTTIRVSDLMAALNVGTVQQLIAAQVSLSQLVSAVVSAGGQNGLTGVSVGTVLAPNTLVLGPLLRNTLINVGNSTGTPGVLQFLAQAGNDQSVLNAQLNVLDLVTTAAQIANNKNAVAISTGLLGTTLNLKVIQPPVIAIGPPGKDTSGNWMTQASAGQVRLGLNVSASVLGLATINVPIGVAVAGASAHAVDAYCPVPRVNLSADIAGTISPVSSCIAAGADAVASGTLNCGSASAASLLSLLGISAASIYSNPPASSSVSFGSDTPYSGLQIAVGQTQRVTATSGFFSALLSSNSNLKVTVLGVLPVPLSAITGELSTVGGILDSLLTPVLELLGVQLGYADIKVLSVNCDAVELVF
ncbi:TadG family pilus assembly protein [Ralstonia pseudosolanacearum]|uniref:TadG family pilus assembly protein n=2 Tax=Ralstonia pseudosolanacearum TaxID=1310165 RepID=UPI0026771E3D|nr:TadG family pilus assembly protein [Ralstonia pseudosolanacearum]MDO3508637.1 TadG family pilus assembly protein [Ralstonia pseudosolanacearum]MDO3513843.1 TadG family pilus assembly protein [Ralstonia pseudosolanacearum]MDO3537936.1 TadG family pilus assembly protein [Ralstonia pseudosolanacearum]MDO3631589.1 TadG family pilus assembly protein [Ralstonia pseudosolanacearum]